MFSPPRDVGAMLDGSKTATDARFFALALRVGVYCLLWFVTSIAVIYTNKYAVQLWRNSAQLF